MFELQLSLSLLISMLFEPILISMLLLIRVNDIDHAEMTASGSDGLTSYY